MKQNCNNCKYWSRQEHHPTSKWWWLCNHQSNKRHEYTPFDSKCKYWENMEAANEDTVC